MRAQVMIRTCSKCFAALRHVRSIRRSVCRLLVTCVFGRPINILLLLLLLLGSVTVACRGAGVLKTRLWAVALRLLPTFRNSSWTGCSVERRCTADLHRQSSGPRPASIAQPTLASSSSSDLVPAGGAGRSWCIAASTALHPPTWRPNCSESHTSMHVGDCALRVRQRSYEVFHKDEGLEASQPASSTSIRYEDYLIQRGSRSSNSQR